MGDYTHITRYENILNSGNVRLEQLNSALDNLEKELEDYKALESYYFSPQRDLDLNDENAGLIPTEISRAVLGEDYIDEFICDKRDTALRLIELGLKILKNE